MLKVQDNTGLINADTYVSVDELNEYISKRGIVLTSDAETLLVKAMDYIDSRQYKSEPVNTDQVTAFPRVGLGVPLAVKRAQLALAVIADTNDLMPNVMPTDRIVKQEQVDSISVTYETVETKNGLPLFSQIDTLLKPYLLKGVGGMGMNIRVCRG